MSKAEYIKAIVGMLQETTDDALVDFIYRLLDKAR